MTLRFVVFLFLSLVSSLHSRGLLLLLKPKDVSDDCAFSQKLRYDLSFGMGMSDTITLVLRTLSEADYECQIEIVTDKSPSDSAVKLIIVIKFPSYFGIICEHNPNAFILLKMDKCYILCDQLSERDYFSYYYVMTSLGRFRFNFINNSSINSDIDANIYEVTATAARMLGPNQSCNMYNETSCVIDQENYCFTSGVICDGIKNCGADDWFDERMSECQLPVQQLGITPVIAIGALSVCALLAGTHLLMQYLPPLAKSFFIFNANEDNRFCIDPTLRPPLHDTSEEDMFRRKSLVPIFSSSSSSLEEEHEDKTDFSEQDTATSNKQGNSHDFNIRKSTMRNVSEMIQERLRSVTDRIWTSRQAYPLQPKTM